MNGTCMETQVCGCDETQIEDATLWYRCEALNSTTTRTWEVNLTLYYTETQTRPALTNANRSCTSPTYCQWYTPTVYAFTYTNATTVSIYALHWYCRYPLHSQGYGYRLRTADLASVNGFYGLEEQCNTSSVADPCLPYGQWNASTLQCDCQEGYTDPYRCRTLIDPLSAPLRLWYQGRFLVNDSIYTLGTSEDDCNPVTELWYTDRCYCAPGAYLSSNSSTGCVFAPSGILPGVWINGTYATVVYSLEDRRMLWFNEANASSALWHAVYTELPLDDNATATFRLDRLHVHLYESAATVANATTNQSCPFTNCSGHGSCNSTTGLCTCDTRWLGAGCDIYDVTCRETYCSDAGTCFANLTCQCDAPSASIPGGYGLNCSYNATECRSLRCSNHGECSDPYQLCACDSHWTGMDCSIALCSGEGATWNGTACTPCPERFTGLFCDEGECSGHGYLPEGEGEDCTCDALWVGEACDRTSCTTYNATQCLTCTAPYLLDTDAPHECYLPCFSTGSYNRLTFQCDCIAAYTGPLCQWVVVQGDNTPLVIGLVVGILVFLMILILLILAWGAPKAHKLHVQ